MVLKMRHLSPSYCRVFGYLIKIVLDILKLATKYFFFLHAIIFFMLHEGSKAQREFPLLEFPGAGEFGGSLGSSCRESHWKDCCIKSRGT